MNHPKHFNFDIFIGLFGVWVHLWKFLKLLEVNIFAEVHLTLKGIASKIVAVLPTVIPLFEYASVKVSCKYIEPF